MLGAIIGDIVGSPFEFARHKSKLFELFSSESSFTDDTICLIAVADSLLNNTDPSDSLRGWCRQYPAPMGGYGARFCRWVFDNSMGPYGSKGNGAAMRVAPVAFLAGSAQEVVRLARHVTAVTHDHPDGLRGAEATAFAIWMARNGASVQEIRSRIASDYRLDLSRSVEEIRPTYQYSELCLDTVPEAIVCALEAKDFEDALRNAVSLGGDADTLAATTGGLAEALYGIPNDVRSTALAYLDEPLRAVLRRFEDVVSPIPRPPSAGNAAAPDPSPRA
jgi:ADP-ribosylglycohydrolase